MKPKALLSVNHRTAGNPMGMNHELSVTAMDVEGRLSATAVNKHYLWV